VIGRLISLGHLNALADEVRTNLRAMCQTSPDDPSHAHADHQSLQFAHLIMHGLWGIREYGDVAKSDDAEPTSVPHPFSTPL
jgi:hypothetical protein